MKISVDGKGIIPYLVGVGGIDPQRNNNERKTKMKNQKQATIWPTESGITTDSREIASTVKWIMDWAEDEDGTERMPYEAEDGSWRVSADNRGQEPDESFDLDRDGSLIYGWAKSPERPAEFKSEDDAQTFADKCNDEIESEWRETIYAFATDVPKWVADAITTRVGRGRYGNRAIVEVLDSSGDAMGFDSASYGRRPQHDPGTGEDVRAFGSALTGCIRSLETRFGGEIPTEKPAEVVEGGAK